MANRETQWFIGAWIVLTAVVAVSVWWGAQRGHLHSDGELCGWNDTKGGRIEVRCDYPLYDPRSSDG